MKEAIDKKRCGANVEKVIIDEFVPSKAIDNANLSKALKVLNSNPVIREEMDYEDYYTINKALLKAQEQEKALDEIQTIMDNWLINGQYESNYALEKIDNVLEKYNI